MTTYSINLKQHQIIHFWLTNLRNAEGYGLHISPSRPSNGESVTELYLTANGNRKRGRQVELHYYTGNNGSSGQVLVDLGNTEDILDLHLSLTPNTLMARTVQLSQHEDKKERVTFDLETQIPTERDHGFWQSGKILLHPNGLLSGRGQQREGKGFGVIQAPAPTDSRPQRSPRVDDEPQPDDYPVIKISGPLPKVYKGK